MVLYVARRYARLVGRLLDDIPPEIDRLMDPATPLFSRPIRQGVGVAEEPNNGESFGMHRSRLVVEGIVDAWNRGLQSVDARLRAVEERFRLNGLDLRRPYLSAGSRDLEELF